MVSDIEYSPESPSDIDDPNRIVPLNPDNAENDELGVDFADC
jgi:hypothetical protein